MLRWKLIGALLAATSLSPIAVATADPPAPQPDTACATGLKDAMTWPAGDPAPLTCDGTKWTTVADPYPISDKWLSYGPAMTLHGEGRRYPTLLSGAWTATPLNPETSCGATQFAVISGSPTVGPPTRDRGEPGQPLSLEVVPKLFTIEMTGDCLWQRSP